MQNAKSKNGLTESIEFYRDLFENANDLIQGVDKEGRFIYVNKKWREALGYTEEEAKKMTFPEIIHPSHLNACMDIFSRMQAGKPVNVFETVFVSKDGSKIDVEGNVSVLIKDGRLVSTRGIFRDVTERKKAEEKLARERQELDRIAKMLVRRDFELMQTSEAMRLLDEAMAKEKEINQAKTEFVSLASHQLKTPLTSVNWYAEMLLAGDAGKVSKKQKNYLEKIYRNNRRMVELVNALLNVSRIEMGTLAIEPKPTDIKEVAESVLDELLPQIKNKKLEIRKNYDKDLPIIDVDPKLIRIVFENLISNSVKYTPENGKIIVIIKNKERNIIIKVSDNGYGIPKNQQSKIFTKLFRADNARTIDPDGTGLGLYIVKAIIKEFGGKIRFTSKIGKGTTFYITIPYQ